MYKLHLRNQTLQDVPIVLSRNISPLSSFICNTRPKIQIKKMREVSRDTWLEHSSVPYILCFKKKKKNSVSQNYIWYKFWNWPIMIVNLGASNLSYPYVYQMMGDAETWLGTLMYRRRVRLGSLLTQLSRFVFFNFVLHYIFLTFAPRFSRFSIALVPNTRSSNTQCQSNALIHIRYFNILTDTKISNTMLKKFSQLSR